MTVKQGKAEVAAIKGLLEQDEDFVRSAVQCFVQAALAAEMTEALAAEKGAHTSLHTLGSPRASVINVRNEAATSKRSVLPRRKRRSTRKLVASRARPDQMEPFDR